MHLNRIPFRQLRPMLGILQSSANIALVIVDDRKLPLTVKTLLANDKTVAMLKSNPTRPQVVASMAWYWLVLDEWAAALDTKSPDLAAQLRALKKQYDWLGRVIDLAQKAQGEKTA